MTTSTRARPVPFWDRIAEKYAKRPVADEAAYQKKLQVTRGYFRPDMKLLEFGCGTGSTAITHAPHVKHIRAIDISSKMIEIAQRKADAQGIENASFECLAIDQLTVPDHSFDMVLGLSILHLVPNRDEVITQVMRMLVPGGLFVTSTVCLGDSMKWFKFVGPIGRFFRLMPLLRVFRMEELTRSLTSAGFAIEYEWQSSKQSLFIVARKPG